VAGDERIIATQLAFDGADRPLRERPDGSLSYGDERSVAPASDAAAARDAQPERLVAVQPALDGSAERKLLWRGAFVWRG
jgi:hypothetical protein